MASWLQSPCGARRLPALLSAAAALSWFWCWCTVVGASVVSVAVLLLVTLLLLLGVETLLLDRCPSSSSVVGASVVGACVH